MTDLHLHLDGSVSAMTLRRISKETGQPLPEDYENRLHYDAKIGTLADYLKCFDLPLSFMQSPENVRFCVMALLEDLYKSSVNYAEIRFAPQLHLNNGSFTQSEIVSAATEGLEYGSLMGVEAKLILCMMRGGSDKANEETVDAALEFLGKGVCALDLAGNEAAYPVELYTDFFNYAKKNSIPFTIHAGEAAGPESIENALKRGASRIGHGIAARHDKELMKYLAKHQIPLELCPTSNIQTGCVKDFESEYPLVTFLEEGICATINTDNMIVSDTDINKEFALIKRLPGMKNEYFKVLKDNSVRARF